MVMSKEERAAKRADNVYKWNHSPAGIKSNRTHKWKKNGIISNDWDATYKRFMDTLNCENTECNVLLTTDRYTTATTKCLDHDHSIINEPNVRAVLCNRCNSNDRSDNSSGVPNINRNRNNWRYERIFNGVKHSRTFNTFEEARDYKTAYELSVAN